MPSSVSICKPCIYVGTCVHSGARNVARFCGWCTHPPHPPPPHGPRPVVMTGIVKTCFISRIKTVCNTASLMTDTALLEIRQINLRLYSLCFFGNSFVNYQLSNSFFLYLIKTTSYIWMLKSSLFKFFPHYYLLLEKKDSLRMMKTKLLRG